MKHFSLFAIRCRHQGSEDQVPSRLLRGQESWRGSESVLAFIHLWAWWSQTQQKPIFFNGSDHYLLFLISAPKCKILWLCSHDTESLMTLTSHGVIEYKSSLGHINHKVLQRVFNNVTTFLRDLLIHLETNLLVAFDEYTMNLNL